MLVTHTRGDCKVQVMIRDGEKHRTQAGYRSSDWPSPTSFEELVEIVGGVATASDAEEDGPARGGTAEPFAAL